MKIGIIKDINTDKNNYVHFYRSVLDHNSIDYHIIDVNSTQLFIDIKNIDHLIFRWGHYDSDRQLAHTILPIIENNLGIRCFPNQHTCWHYDDKVRQYYIMRAYGYPFIDCYIFWDKTSALKWIDTATFPLIFKLKGGAGSKNVQLIKSRQRAKRLVNQIFTKGIYQNNIDQNTFSLKRYISHLGGMLLRKIAGEEVGDTWQKEKNYILFQKYLPNNEFDTRITTIGKRAFAFRRFNRSNDFRASGSGKIDYDMSKIDIRCIKKALEISISMEFQTMAYDFIYNDSGEPEFCEISYTYQDNAVFNCPGYWDENMKFHEGHFLPQYFHVMDLLDLPSLQQPDNVNFKSL